MYAWHRRKKPTIEPREGKAQKPPRKRGKTVAGPHDWDHAIGQMQEKVSERTRNRYGQNMLDIVRGIDKNPPTTLYNQGNIQDPCQTGTLLEAVEVNGQFQRSERSRENDQPLQTSLQS